ncbi:hypothetical protein, partial [Escherichia coli]|uniref:hypothetical protein n=1 Tax=Escherichia coli TaxID=562 RepID=UPI001BD684DD
AINPKKKKSPKITFVYTNFLKKAKKKPQQYENKTKNGNDKSPNQKPKPTNPTQPKKTHYNQHSRQRQ